MKRSGFLSITLLALLSFFVITLTACQKKGIETTPDTSPKTEQASDTKRKVTDMRGVEVSLPDRIDRVAIIDKGSVLQTMTAIGVADKIVSSGDFTGAKERDSLVLKPDLLDLPNLGYPTSAVDYETLARSKPDIVILRNSEYIKENQITKDAINKIENDLKIPLVVVNGGGCYKDGGYEKNLEGIKLLGKVFSKEKEADEIVKVIESKIDLIKKRTMSVPENKRPWESVIEFYYPYIYPGELFVKFPKSDLIYGCLSQMGIPANVRVLTESHFSHEFSCRDDVIKNIRKRLKTDSDDFDDIFDRTLERFFYQKNDRWFFNDKTTYVEISWEKRYEE